MKGDSCIQRGTGLLLTPKSPELDILRSHAEIRHDKAQRPGGEQLQTSIWSASSLDAPGV